MTVGLHGFSAQVGYLDGLWGLRVRRWPLAAAFYRRKVRPFRRLAQASPTSLGDWAAAASDFELLLPLWQAWFGWARMVCWLAAMKERRLLFVYPYWWLRPE